MADTTDLSALPVDPTLGGGGPQNVKIANPAQALAQQRQAIPAGNVPQMAVPMQGQPQMQGMPPPQGGQPMTRPPPQGTPQDMNAMITGLQEAAATGMTSLPARDIPRETVQHVADPRVRVEHVPKHEDYIASHNDRQREAAHALVRKQNQEDTMEVVHSELQGPLVMAALFFIFQLPFLRKGIMRFIPGMLTEDGHYNIYGYLVVSLLFAGTYYGIDKAIVSMVSA